ncbi:porin [Noviherbaspirillum massiliense]|uniref:porin n=1 Tax=Noviherbaspirillum massiliense TaxID=1465823 RepID=UPI0002F9D6C9|nr:porin [Noviherbaspirillum massiliense]
MKKSLLALAVLGAFAGVAHAQTNVTVYGVVDAGINYDDGKQSDKVWALQSGQQSGSRIGFRGTEDLGGGLSAVFTLENGFSTDDGTLGNGGRLFGRQAWVGLNGGFGSVKLGRQYNAIYNALNAIDPFGINQAGDMQRVYGYGLGKVDPISRSDNTITYTSPNIAGFTGQVGYKFGENAGAFNTGSSKFVGLAYVAGPVNVQAAYSNTNALSLGTAASTSATATLNPIAAQALAAGLAGTAATAGGVTTTTVRADVKNALIGATYDFGVVKAHALFGDSKVENAGADIKIRNYMLGVSAPVGAVGSVYASWNRNDFRDFDDAKSNQYAIGYSHSLSKRTNLYTSFGYTKNDDGVRLNAFAAGESDKEFQLGVRHTF